MLPLWQVNYFGSLGAFGEEKAEKVMNKSQTKEDKNMAEMGTIDQLMKGMMTFSDWMWTGKVHPDEDAFVNKEYILKLAAALDAPLFRAAILKGPILSDSFFSDPLSLQSSSSRIQTYSSSRLQSTNCSSRFVF